MKNKKNLKAQQVVENLAAQLLNPALSSSAREALVNDITLAVMAYEGWSSCDCSRLQEDQTLEVPDEYSNVVLWEAVSYALRDYGKTDAKTGNVIPFCQLVNHALKLKAADVVKEKLADQDRLDQCSKKAAVEAYLRRLLKEKGEPAVELRFNVLNKEAVKHFMQKYGCSDAEVEVAMSLIESNYVAYDDVNVDDGEDDNLVQLTDIQVHRDFQFAQNYLDGAFSTFSAALNTAGNSKDAKALKQLVTYHCFTQGYDDTMNVFVYLEDYIDSDFYEFLCSYNGPLKDDRAIAAYTGHKLDTVQKTLCSARALLKRQAAAKKEKTISVCW